MSTEETYGKEFEDLFSAAEKTLDKAYSPYSGFRVASAALMNDGQIYTGCNVENASYGATICAERVAMCKGVSEGARHVKSLLVLTDTPDPWPPCGICRQFLLEFSYADTKVYISNLRKKAKSYTVTELCPDSFSPKYMDETKPTDSSPTES